jgi:outer membrane protein insertion porin family
MAGFNIKKGDVYNSERIGKALFIIQQEYSNIGYLKAGIEAPERPVGIDSVNIQFNVVEKTPVTVNRIDIKGNTKTKEKVIRRELKIKPGDIFNYAKLTRSFRDISILNYFSNIGQEFKFIDEERTALDLTITVEEKSTDTANMSAGFSQRDGMIGALGLSMNNLMGNGQQLYIDWQFGRIYRSFQIGFTEPWLFDTPTSGGFSIFDVHRGGEFYGYEQDSKGITFRVGRRLKWPDDYFRGDWYFEYSNNRYSNVQNGLNLSQYLIREKTTQVSITQIIMRSSQGNEKNPAIAAEFPSNGSTVSFSSQYSGGILTGTENFIKFTLNTDWYTPALYHFVLYQNVLMGLIKNLDPKYNLSPQELFFLGGSALTIGTALRGYDDRMVGPLSEDNSWPLGGQALLKATTELRFNISRNPTIYGLFFAEAGNNWLNISYTNPFDLKRSTGAGLRFFMPMLGMVGFDIAYGFDNYTSPGKRRGWMPHFQFGRGF